MVRACHGSAASTSRDAKIYVRQGTPDVKGDAPRGIGSAMMHARQLPVFRRGIQLAGMCAALMAVFPLPSLADTCAGDCDGNLHVSIGEIILGVDIDLGLADISACRTVDVDANNVVTVNEIIGAVKNGLAGCPIPPTATPPVQATVVSGRVLTFEPFTREKSGFTAAARANVLVQAP